MSIFALNLYNKHNIAEREKTTAIRMSCPTTQYCGFYKISIASTILMLYKILPIGKIAQTNR